MFVINVKKEAKENAYFRKVLYTGAYSQVVVMHLEPGQDIGEEVHETVDQLIEVVDGDAEVMVGDEKRLLEEHELVAIPAGTKHNLKNIGDEGLKLFTVYSPPQHKDATVHKTKEEAEKHDE